MNQKKMNPRLSFSSFIGGSVLVNNKFVPMKCGYFVSVRRPGKQGIWMHGSIYNLGNHKWLVETNQAQKEFSTRRDAAMYLYSLHVMEAL